MLYDAALKTKVSVKVRRKFINMSTNKDDFEILVNDVISDIACCLQPLNGCLCNCIESWLDANCIFQDMINLRAPRII